MNKLIMEPLFYIYLVYGASFMAMSLFVVNGITKGSSLTLVSSFYMLVFFGVTHGIAELTDWVRFASNTLGYGDNDFLLYISQISMIISFVCLLQFAVNLLSYKSGRKDLYKTIPFLLLIAFLVVVYSVGISDIHEVGLFARYGFGFTGSALSAIMLYQQGSAMKLLGNKKVVIGFLVAAVGFGLYAVCGGLVVTPVFGYPIQLYRALCAVIITVASTAVIGVFKVE